MPQDIRLSVNINKVALIRNARGGNRPDLLKFAAACERFGAEGITVHPRPDERHIRYSDLQPLKEVVQTELNIEGYPNDRFMKKVLDVKPDQVTLVPDPPGVLTSNTGWDTNKHAEFLKGIINDLQKEQIRVSVFLNPDPELIPSAAETGADRIELYTGNFADAYEKGLRMFEDHIKTAARADKHGLGVNAGHDLDLTNLAFYTHHVPHLLEVSIGHALVSDSLYFGLQNVIQMYQHQIKGGMPTEQ